MRILIHVQHLLGIGHLQRIGLIARALDAAGVTVTLPPYLAAKAFA